MVSLEWKRCALMHSSDRIFVARLSKNLWSGLLPRLAPALHFCWHPLAAFSSNAVEYNLLVSGDKQRQPDSGVVSGGNVLYHKAWSGSSQCRSVAGVQAGTQLWKTEVAVEIPPAMSMFRQVSSFLTPELEIGMAHMFGWKPSQDILKPCPKSFSETVVLV